MGKKGGRAGKLELSPTSSRSTRAGIHSGRPNTSFRPSSPPCSPTRPQQNKQNLPPSDLEPARPRVTDNIQANSDPGGGADCELGQHPPLPSHLTRSPRSGSSRREKRRTDARVLAVFSSLSWRDTKTHILSQSYTTDCHT
ncbi:hypothetical protein LZ32DRAFT_153288 [Colletotrichum eremochloae]|nr:hypothetical protein LZ32DRAFT_153288 [Colletotrichum eremochloae]